MSTKSDMVGEAWDACCGEDGKRLRDLEHLERLRPIDDDFMRVIYRDNIPLTEETLRIVTGIEGLKVVSAETQRDLKRLVGARSVELDVMATDTSGRWHDIEVQRGDKPRPKRARYHSAAMDVEALDSGHESEELPEQWVIFIMEQDPFGQGKGVYLFERSEVESGVGLGDGTRVLYANGEYRADDELGALMQAFCESDPDAMANGLLAERVRYLKRTPKGVRQMCEIFDEIRHEGVQEGLEQGIRQGIEQGVRQGIEQGIEQGEERMLIASMRSLMERLSFSAQEAFDALSVPEAKRPKYLAML